MEPKSTTPILGTLADLVNGDLVLPDPIYLYKPYVILGKDGAGMILAADTLEGIKAHHTEFAGYYDDCPVDIRRHDLYLADNSRYFEEVSHAPDEDYYPARQPFGPLSPAPWSTVTTPDEYTISDAYQHTVAHIYRPQAIPQNIAQAKANALVIEAAPRLLNALERLLAQVEPVLETLDQDGYYRSAYANEVEVAKVAIQIARGLPRPQGWTLDDFVNGK